MFHAVHGDDDECEVEYMFTFCDRSMNGNRVCFSPVLFLSLRKIINKSSCIIIILVLYYTTIIRFACPTAFTILSLRSHSTLYNIILAQYGSTTINTILVECVHHKILLLSFSHFSSSCLSPLSNSVRGSLLRKRF